MSLFHLNHIWMPIHVMIYFEWQTVDSSPEDPDGKFRFSPSGWEKTSLDLRGFLTNDGRSLYSVSRGREEDRGTSPSPVAPLSPPIKWHSGPQYAQNWQELSEKRTPGFVGFWLILVTIGSLICYLVFKGVTLVTVEVNYAPTVHYYVQFSCITESNGYVTCG